MTCASCGAEHPAGKKFCSECGAALTLSCPVCGSPLEGREKFCSECGTALVAQSHTVSPPPLAPAAERRLVSVLFADLVGFTSLSESRDAEDTRELLSRYFETCRRLIERYGGTVEKFIGDAVMAVWGAPVATEDDAERAVRAALELVQAVAALGHEVGAHELRARAGILTGEAAVTLGAEGQGMVAGDLVNTASRIQSTAAPGTVLVGDSTKRATEAAVVYEDAGSHELKGKAEPIQLYQATRVVATMRGTVKSTALEPPFVGRDLELRLVKELFHAATDDRKTHLVSVLGVGGIGKSRLAWEFEKYVDGLAADTWWHWGRCLAYGEGVAFWALAEMIRGRAGIVEDEPSASAAAKLRATIERHVPDADERRFLEPRLAHLLGLEDRGQADQENLFAASRMFFERVADSGPTVLVFEDIHWADSALIDFIEYLLEWSRDRPIFILTLARPDLTERHPTWGAGKRSFTSLVLEPLSHDVMDVLLTTPVPGLPDELRERILARAEGIPFYAVETVRMLLDRGLLTREGTRFRPTGPIETLEVPETLQALIAARLDGLAPEERRLLQDASVLGRSFTMRGLVAMSGLEPAVLEPLLASLIRKEVLALTADPLSAEHGQYGFLQDLVKKVAYDTLSRRERKTRHLAAAAHLRSLGDDDEVVEVIAAHYLDAYRAAPDDPDAEQVRAEARATLERSGDRAASLGANAEAEARYDEAAALAEDPLVEAELLERAGMMAYAGARADEAAERYERSIALFEASEDARAAARVSARHAEILWDRGRLEQGLERMDRAFHVLSQEEPNADLAELAAQVGRFMFFHGEHELALERVETALDMAEALFLPEVLSQALNTKAVVLVSHERPREGLTLMRYALEIALENEKPSAALRAHYNLADSLARLDRFEDAVAAARSGLALSRRVGNRYWEWSFAAQVYGFFALGLWDEGLELSEQLPEADWTQARLAFAGLPTSLVPIHVHRGQLEEAEQLMSMLAELGTSADVQERAQYLSGQARLRLAQGRPAEALASGRAVLEERAMIGMSSESMKEAFVSAVEAAFELGEHATVEELLRLVDEIPPGRSPQFLQAHASRFRARLADDRGQADEAERQFKRAAGLFRELAVPLYLAVTQLERAESLRAQGRGGEAPELIAEAREIFERLDANVLLDRIGDAVEARA